MSPLARQVLADCRNGWVALLATGLLYRLAAFTVLWPLVAAALRAFMAFSGTAAVADQDILFLVLTPAGFLGLVVVLALGLSVVALEQACLMTLGFGLRHGDRVNALAALRLGLTHAKAVLRVSLRLVLRGLLAAAPFLLAAGATYSLLLRDYDINYYLSERPPAFWAAVTIVAALAVGLAVVLIPRLLGWSLALPLVLFEGARPDQALALSAERTAGHRWPLGCSILAWAGLMALLGALSLAAVGVLGRLLVPLAGDSLHLVLPVVGGLVILWAGSNLVLSVLQAATFGLLLVGWYDRVGGGESVSRRFAADLAAAEQSARWRFPLRRVIAGIVAVGLLAALTGGWLLDGLQTEDNALVIAHRGAAAAAPENTLASITRAIEDRADIVEIDVQETADGEVVVFHDSDFMKLAQVHLKIWEATLAEVQDIDIGSSFAPEFNRERVPRLADVLALCKDKVRVDIELKYYGHDQQLEERVVAIVEAAGMESQVIFMSLKYDAVRKMKQLRPGWTVGLLAAQAIGDLTRLEADFLAVNTGLASRSFIQSAHRRGKPVYAWTVNDALQMSRLLSMGVDGLITDRPALARAVLERRATLSCVERLLLNLAFWLDAIPNDLVEEARKANELAAVPGLERRL